MPLSQADAERRTLWKHFLKQGKVLMEYRIQVLMENEAFVSFHFIFVKVSLTCWRHLLSLWRHHNGKTSVSLIKMGGKFIFRYFTAFWMNPCEKWGKFSKAEDRLYFIMRGAKVKYNLFTQNTNFPKFRVTRFKSLDFLVEKGNGFQWAPNEQRDA